MTLHQWKQSPELIKEARQLWVSNTFQDMLSVLVNHEPSGTFRPTPITPTEAAIDLGRVQGYREALELIQSLCEYPPDPVPEVEMDYGAEQILAEEQHPQ